MALRASSQGRWSQGKLVDSLSWCYHQLKTGGKKEDKEANLVVGLGTSVQQPLPSTKWYEVLVMDKTASSSRKWQIVTYAVQADATDEAALRSVGSATLMWRNCLGMTEVSILATA